jgi:hypothetical protein
MHVYEVRPRKDKRGVDLISDALPFSRLWYNGLNAIGNTIRYAKFFSRSHDAVIQVYDEAGQCGCNAAPLSLLRGDCRSLSARRLKQK